LKKLLGILIRLTLNVLIFFFLSLGGSTASPSKNIQGKVLVFPISKPDSYALSFLDVFNAKFFIFG
jgi:hypothetical protein